MYCILFVIGIENLENLFNFAGNNSFYFVRNQDLNIKFILFEIRI